MIKVSANWSRPQRGLLPKALLRTPIQRIGAPEEVAAFVSYVASDSAGFVTGKVGPFINRHIYSPGSAVYAPGRPMCMSIFLCLFPRSICRFPSMVVSFLIERSHHDRERGRI
jgi:hypothetical protein